LALARYKQRVLQPFPEQTKTNLRYCAVYGYPVRHSASPAMQNAGIAALGLKWRYLAFEVRPEKLREALEDAKEMKLVGVNLTVPHKLLAMDMMDALDESARAWGAVNTVRFETRDVKGAWRPLGQFARTPNELRAQGFNTDAEAITRALQEDLQLQVRGARILVLGAGGAGRTAALKLAADGAGELFLVNRTYSKAAAVAEEIRERWPEVPVTLGYPQGTIDLVLNATSLGLKADDPVPYDAGHFSLSRAAAVYDMIYRPAETPLLKEARQAGCRVANGISMLLYQGAKALELWSGRTAPVEVMRAALVQNVYG
jgi:shikimate dehydrogenase